MSDELRRERFKGNRTVARERMFRRFLREGITGWTVLEVPMGDEVFQVHFRKAALRNGYAEADAPAEAASVDEMAELLSFLGGLATSADVISLGMGVAR